MRSGRERLLSPVELRPFAKRGQSSPLRLSHLLHGTNPVHVIVINAVTTVLLHSPQSEIGTKSWSSSAWKEDTEGGGQQLLVVTGGLIGAHHQGDGGNRVARYPTEEPA